VLNKAEGEYGRVRLNISSQDVSYQELVINELRCSKILMSMWRSEQDLASGCMLAGVETLSMDFVVRRDDSEIPIEGERAILKKEISHHALESAMMIVAVVLSIL